MEADIFQDGWGVVHGGQNQHSRGQKVLYRGLTAFPFGLAERKPAWKLFQPQPLSMRHGDASRCNAANL
jgi:hypothetical protein